MLRVILSAAGRERFAALTRANIGRYALVRIDDRLIVRPMIVAAITGGSVSIVGLDSREAESTAARRRDGRSVLTIGVERGTSAARP